MKDRIGFIGVGTMGLPMARRLLAAGYHVGFTTRRQQAAEALEAAGGRTLPTPLVVADHSDTLLTCLPSDRELFEVYLGPEGVLEHLRPGATVIDLSTTSPMIMQRIAADAQSRSIHVIDAPVSGGVSGAESGQLTIMVGAEPEDLDAARPVLDVLGSRIFHVGAVGMGKVFKIINNLLNGGTLVLIGEALSLAANAGADLDVLYDVVASSSGSSRAWVDAVPKLIHGPSTSVGFRLELMRKDIGLATSLAEDLRTPVPVAALVQQFYTAACARGLGEREAYAVAQLVARLADASFAPTEQVEPSA